MLSPNTPVITSVTQSVSKVGKHTEFNRFRVARDIKRSGSSHFLEVDFYIWDGGLQDTRPVHKRVGSIYKSSIKQTDESFCDSCRLHLYKCELDD